MGAHLMIFIQVQKKYVGNQNICRFVFHSPLPLNNPLPRYAKVQPPKRDGASQTRRDGDQDLLDGRSWQAAHLAGRWKPHHVQGAVFPSERYEPA